MRVLYLPKFDRLVVGRAILSKEHSESLIKEAGAAVRFGAKATEETLLGKVFLATKKTTN